MGELKRVKVWAFGLIREEFSRTTEGGTITEIKAVKVAGIVLHRVSTSRPAVGQQEPVAAFQAPVPGAYDIKQREAMALEIEKNVAAGLIVTTQWVRRHYHGHILNNLKAGLDPKHINDLVAALAAKKIRRGGAHE